VGARSTSYWVPHTTTPNDILRVLQAIADPSHTSPELSAEMLVDEAAELLGISREKVSVLIRDRVLIEATAPDGRWGLSGYSLLSERDFRATAPSSR
jgi:hypothetical protein